MPLKRSGAERVPLGLLARVIGTTGLAPGTGSPQVPQKASVLTTFALQFLHCGIDPVRPMLRSYAGLSLEFNRRGR